MQREIEVLKECIGIRVRINDTGEWIEVTPSIEKAIKCMELLPKLVQVIPLDCDGLYNKAKEMLSDES